MKRVVLFVVCLASALFPGAEPARGNAVSITNVALINASNGTAQIQFDVSWSNSWRSVWTEDGGFTFVTNWDAAWVFAKFRVSGGDWRPIMFTTNGHTAPAGTSLTVAQNGGATNPGVFLFRDAEGAGGVNYSGAVLQFDYVASGLYGTNQLDVVVFATEMVYTPEGAFYLGSGSPEDATFQTFTNSAAPFRITNEAAMAVGLLTGALNTAVGGGYGGSMSGTLSNAFPKGFAAFYAMKYEISQGQYADFLNHIQPGLAAVRFPNTSASRHTITYDGTNYVAGAPDRACNYINWDDVCVFLDWAGLRPMSEMEYEKMCRGFKAPVPSELAYGDVGPTYLTGFTGTDGSGTETVANAGANLVGNGNIAGPVRVGIFATAATDRFKSGAGYFGCMELSGNLYESVITAGSAVGRAFAGTHGDGNASTSQPSDWPSIAVNSGFGARGGGYADAVAGGRLRVADRYYAGNTGFGRHPQVGGRGVRTAP